MEIIKENNKLNVPKNGIENVEKEKQEYKFIDTINLRQGMKLYSFDRNENKVEEVVIQKECSTIDFSTLEAIDNGRAMFNPYLVYIEASNYKNALRKSKRDNLICHTSICAERKKNAMSIKMY